jgi:chemotaxis protein methyltransferase WspC
MRTLADMLQQRIGLDPASIGDAMIDRAVRGRAAVHTAGDVDAYLHHVDQDATEFQALVDAVVVPETWFFRYPESIAAMTSEALRRLSARPAAPLRILSLPCSTGEEPYTIAMALLDAGVAPARFRIDAADISARNVDAAAAAVYRSNSFRGADLSFRDRHFVRQGAGYALSPAVRAVVRLHRDNLLSPTLALPVGAYDLVFCRNLLIYFDAATQTRSIHILAGLARPDGLLFVGPAEASVLTRLRHRSIGVPMAFAFHALPGMPAPDRFRDQATGALPRAASPWGADVTARAQASVTAPPAAVRPATSGTESSPPASPAAEIAASFAHMNALADQGRFDDALKACDTHLAEFGPSATAFYRQGLFNDAARRPHAARDAYRKALYLDPQHPQALLQLAALLDAEGDAGGAARLRQRMRRHEVTP